MWDLIVSVPGHCLSFYFAYNQAKRDWTFFDCCKACFCVRHNLLIFNCIIMKQDSHILSHNNYKKNNNFISRG